MLMMKSQVQMRCPGLAYIDVVVEHLFQLGAICYLPIYSHVLLWVHYANNISILRIHKNQIVLTWIYCCILVTMTPINIFVGKCKLQHHNHFQQMLHVGLCYVNQTVCSCL
jgi:hypothetical protein